ncbi:hypothetical protein [uncultured Sneathia sp.]|uniref:hypothetical protein n=1 Tax=uncultured Sneathia sp. TaxID=278067 RepID=UPI002595CEF8|nr:hypothetical protein [uncultured Sneathia sp.]
MYINDLSEINRLITHKLKVLCKMYNLEYNEDEMEFIIENEYYNILNFINRTSFPSALLNVLVQRTFGNYLELKTLVLYSDIITESSNKAIEESGSNTEAPVSEIKEYDTAIKFDTELKLKKLQEQNKIKKDKLNFLIDKITEFKEFGKNELYSNRRNKW